LHIVVAGGGLSPDGTRWISCRPNFFLPVEVLSRLFRRLFLHALQQAFDAGNLQFFSALEPLRTPRAFRRHLARLRSAEWVVYTKAPFDGPEQVLRYVARYTHRVAISNDRVLDIEDGRVSFSWKDYRDNNQRKTMTLAALEFIRRFLMHVLPKGFQRIRHYGFLANRARGRKLGLCRQLLRMPPHEPGCYLKKDYRQRYEEITGRSLTQCPICKQGEMLVIEVLPDTRPRRRKHPAPRTQFANCPPFMDTS
jgi:putative transposase